MLQGDAGNRDGSLGLDGLGLPGARLYQPFSFSTFVLGQKFASPCINVTLQVQVAI